jgi:diamine N-acetyltransferase
MTHIRLATRADCDAIVALNEQVQAIHVAARPDYFKTPERAAAAKWLAGMLEDASIRVWLALREDRPVGYVLVMIKERDENPFCRARLTCEIDQIAVDAAERGTGVGAALIAAAVAHAADNDIEHIELNVWAFNDTARRAFERCGFVPRTLTLEKNQSSRKSRMSMPASRNQR